MPNHFQVQLQQAKDKAVEFDTSYQTLLAELQKKDQTLKEQEPIHSEVEVVKRQLEENKVISCHEINSLIANKTIL